MHDGPPPTRVTRDEAIQRAGALLAAARQRMAALSTQEAAQAAWVPGGPDVAELEARIRVARGL